MALCQKRLRNALTEELGKHVASDLSLFNSHGWERLVTMRRGSQPLAPTVRHLRHPASRLLEYMRNCGVPVELATAPWNQGQLAAALARGPHPSAKLHAEFVIQEMIDMWHKGQVVLLPANVARQMPQLRLSPPASIEQRGRRNRNLLDLSFSRRCWRWGEGGRTPLVNPIAQVSGIILHMCLDLSAGGSSRQGCKT